MTFYNDFTPFTTVALATALLCLVTIGVLRRTGAMTSAKRIACELLLVLAIAAVTAMSLASWPVWGSLLGPAAAVLPLLLIAFLGLELALTHRAAVAARSER